MLPVLPDVFLLCTQLSYLLDDKWLRRTTLECSRDSRRISIYEELKLRMKLYELINELEVREDTDQNVSIHVM